MKFEFRLRINSFLLGFYKESVGQLLYSHYLILNSVSTPRGANVNHKFMLLLKFYNLDNLILFDTKIDKSVTTMTDCKRAHS